MSSRPQPSAVIFAKDFEALAGFYSAVADMPEVSRGDDHIVLAESGFQLVIHAIPKRIAAKIQITRPPAIRKDIPIKVCLPVIAIANARAKASELGGLIGSKSKEWTARGFTACDGNDPEGNVFQVREIAG
jgi:Glyoxalase-like domain